MSNRWFEMFEYRTVLMRMRQGDSESTIAKAGLTGRTKDRKFRAVANVRGWLPPDNPLPEEQEIARAVPVHRCPDAKSNSSVGPYRVQVKEMVQEKRLGHVWIEPVP